MTRPAGISAESIYRSLNAAAARKSFDAAEALLFSTQDEPSEREAATETLLLLYRHCARAALTALTHDGALERWSNFINFDLEAPPAVKDAVPHALVAQLASGSLEFPGELPEARRQGDRLLAAAEAPQRAKDRLRARRLFGAGIVAITALVVTVVSMSIASRIQAPVDLGKGHPWKASSKFADCFPDREECGGAKTTIFFHTQEEDSPWVQFDLGAPTTVSSVTVENRPDLALERAVPLVIELSDDGATWREVARRDKVFDTWRASFPSQKTRFVRARVARRSILHLTALRIHP